MTAQPALSRRNLSAIELFRGLSASALEDALELTLCRRMNSDTRIFNQGDAPVRAHALIEGSVRIAQSGSDGGQIVVRFIGPARCSAPWPCSPTAAIQRTRIR
jgi:CRP-like cAMP-binding protein